MGVQQIKVTYTISVVYVFMVIREPKKLLHVNVNLYC